VGSERVSNTEMRKYLNAERSERINEFQTLKSWPNFASVRATYRFPDAALAAKACCSFF
jgi:hypothetical protein